MAQRITAVVENGLLRPTEPLSLAEGRKVELVVVQGGLTPEEEARIRAHEQALDELQAEGARYSEEWWDEFQRDLEANRMNFQEREWAFTCSIRTPSHC